MTAGFVWICFGGSGSNSRCCVPIEIGPESAHAHRFVLVQLRGFAPEGSEQNVFGFAKHSGYFQGAHRRRAFQTPSRSTQSLSGKIDVGFRAASKIEQLEHQPMFARTVAETSQAATC